MSMFKNVNVVSVEVTNWEQAKKFYTETLEWPVSYASDEMGWIEFGHENETHISISRWNDPSTLPPRSNRVTIVLTVADAQKTKDWLQSKGVKCDDIVTIPGVVRFGSFYDPEGNRLQFAEGSSPAA